MSEPAAEQRHDPTLHSAGRHGCWCTCSCGWTSPLFVGVPGAHLAFGEHLILKEAEAR